MIIHTMFHTQYEGSDKLSRSKLRLTLIRLHGTISQNKNYLFIYGFFNVFNSSNYMAMKGMKEVVTM
jgi:hypothetical protein